jgi:hypothetical protein
MMKSDKNPPDVTTPPPSDSRRRLLRGGLAAAPVVMTVASRPVLGQVACTASAITSINLQSSINHTCSITSGLSPEKWKTLAAQWPSPYSGASSATGTATAGTTTTTTTTSTSRTTSNALLQQQLAGSGSTGTASTGTTTTTSGGTSPYGTASSYASAYYPASTTQTNTATMYHCPTTGLGGHVFNQKTMIDVIDLTSGGLNSLGRYTVAALLNARSGRTPMLNETTVRAMWNDLINRGYYEPTAGVRWGAAEIVAYIKTTIA